jgi:hypothetical protein
MGMPIAECQMPNECCAFLIFHRLVENSYRTFLLLRAERDGVFHFRQFSEIDGRFDIGGNRRAGWVLGKVVVCGSGAWEWGKLRDDVEADLSIGNQAE